MSPGFSIWPDQASSVAGRVDALFGFLLGVSLLMVVIIAALIVGLSIRFRRKKGRGIQHLPQAPNWLEAAWLLLPLAVGVVVFVWGAFLYAEIQRSPAKAMEATVVAKQWMWKLRHSGGRQEINELHVPAGHVMKLLMTSQDVIHSFYVPAFRLKQDVLPGRYTTMWFEPTRPGEYHLFCAEYCGTDHSKMGGKIVVMEPARFQQWLEGGAPEQSPAQRGAALFEKLGCNTCHEAQAGERGPPLAALFGSKVLLADGRRVVADENYLRESILDSLAKIVKGYQSIMPTYRKLLDEEAVLDLIAYIKSLSAPKQEQAQENT